MPKPIVRQADRVAIFHDAMRKGAPFAGYEDFDDCTSKNSDKDDSSAYCGEIKHRTEDKTGAVSRPSRFLLLPHWDPQAVVDIVRDHAEDMGHHHGAPQVTPELMNMAHQGGFTLHDHIGDAPTNGYMVSRNKSTERSWPADQLRSEHVSNYVNQHVRELADPHTYLGGWLNGDDHKFYLDVSTHRPTLDRAASDAVGAKQLAVYDLGKGQALNTPDAVMQSGDIGLATTPRPKNPLTSARTPDEQQAKFQQFVDSLPDHDWTQHGLGDAEHWGHEESGTTGREVDASFRWAETAPAGITPPAGPTFDPKQVQYHGEAPGSTHGAKIFRNPTTSENWLVKEDPTGGMLAHGDVAAGHIAQLSGIDTPPTFHTTIEGKPASAQLMYEGAKDAFPKGPINPEKISDDDLLEVQKHHALDWLIGNHDSHERQFIRKPDGKLVGIDKGQAFKYFSNDKLHWNYHPNSIYSENEPVYNTLYRNHAMGGRPVNDPRQGELGKYIQGLQAISDDEYAEHLRPYAEAGAKAGFLANDWGKKYNGGTKARLKPNDVDGFLAAAVARKHSLMDDMGDLYDRAHAHRMTGEKIARIIRQAGLRQGTAVNWDDLNEGDEFTSHPPEHEGYKPTIKVKKKYDNKVAVTIDGAPGTLDRFQFNEGTFHHRTAMAAPNPELMKNLHKQLGTHGARVYSDPQGQWLVKHPPEGAEFMVPLDQATAHLQQKVGLENPETHTIPWNHQNVTAVKMIPGAKQAWEKSPRLSQTDPKDIMALQKHQAMDWLIGNHDGHVGNFMRTPEGGLVGIDKGQAFKYYGRDRLDPSFHPNYYARPPVYNQLWNDFSAGHPGEMHDPRKPGEYQQFVHELESIPDDDLKSIFRPFAQQAAGAGLLANVQDRGHPGVTDPQRRLGNPTITPNDPEEFLEAMAKRKNNLSKDLGNLYDQASSSRPGSEINNQVQEQKQRAIDKKGPNAFGPGLNVLAMIHDLEVLWSR